MAGEEDSKTKRTLFWVGRRARGVSEGATNIASSVGRGTISAASKTPKEIISTVGIPFKLVLRILVWGTVILIFLTMANYIIKGELYDRTINLAEKLHVKGPLLSAIEVAKNVISAEPIEEGELGFTGTTRTEKEVIGIRINEFKPQEKNVPLNKPILATAEVEVIKTPEDQEIELNFENACYLEDYTDLEAPKQVVVSPQNIPLIAGEENFIFSVRCEFLDGFDRLKPYVSGEIPLTDKEVSVERESYDYKKLRFTPKFTYKQEIDWQPFVKNNRESTDKKLSASWDLSEGPASLRIGSGESQPFYIGDEHVLYVYLTANWPGELKELNYLQLDVPNDIELITDNKFCDFTKQGNRYYLKAPVLETTKIDCGSKQTLKGLAEGLIPGGKIPLVKKSETTFEECIKSYKTEFKFSCPFIVNGAEQVAARTQMNVKANYIYEMQATDSLTLINTKPTEE